MARKSASGGALLDDEAKHVRQRQNALQPSLVVDNNEPMYVGAHHLVHGLEARRNGGKHRREKNAHGRSALPAYRQTKSPAAGDSNTFQRTAPRGLTRVHVCTPSKSAERCVRASCTVTSRLLYVPSRARLMTSCLA